MKKIKLITLGLIVILITAVLIAYCNHWFFVNRYNATLYSYAKGFISTDFYYANKISTYYRNPEYVEGVTDESLKFIINQNMPEERIVVITDQEKYDEIVVNDQPNVDFENKMVIIYIFTSTTSDRTPYFLRDITLNDGVLNIKYGLENTGENGGLFPYARCFLITIDKLNVSEIVFNKINVLISL